MLLAYAPKFCLTTLEKVGYLDSSKDAFGLTAKFVEEEWSLILTRGCEKYRTCTNSIHDSAHFVKVPAHSGFKEIRGCDRSSKIHVLLI